MGDGAPNKRIKLARHSADGLTGAGALAAYARCVGHTQGRRRSGVRRPRTGRIDRTVGELCRRGSPPEHADQLRTVYEVDGHSVSVYEERPPWDGIGDWTRMGVARFRYFRSRDEWQLYWMRQDLRWHLYWPEDEMPKAICPRRARAGRSR